MRRVVILMSVMWLSINMIYAQTGPAGVGNGTNNVLWLKANAGSSSTTDGTAISSWDDQSGNSIHVGQSNALQRPVYRTNVLNGQPAIEFDNNTSAGHNDYLMAPDNSVLDNTNGYTFFTVTKMKNLNGNARSIVAKRNNVDSDEAFMFFYYTSNHIYLDIDGTVNRLNTSPTAYSTNTGYLFNAVYDGTLSSANRSKIYEGEILRKTATEASAVVNDKPSPLLIGTTHTADNRPFGGYIAEVIIYRTALNEASRIVVSNYLSAKYNLPLTANNYYVGDDPANGDYDLEVAGIGQELSGNTNNVASSVSGGIGINSNTGLETGDYLLLGHAAPVNAYITTDIGGMTGVNNARWNRIWYADLTNSSATLNANLEFDMSDGGLSGATMENASDYVLLYRSGQSGNWTELTTASSVAGDKVYFNGIDITADGYYTIGLQNYSAAPLPVQWLSLEGTILSGKVSIDWKTVSEKDNDFFTVERSADGIFFETVEIVKGTSSSTVINSYTSWDYNPYDGKSYYRIKQTDLDGKISYSSVISVEYMRIALDMSVFPNPVSTADPVFYVSFPEKEQEVLVVVRDIHGREFFSRVIVQPQANELIQVETEGKLSAGMYLVIASSDHQMYSRKFMVR
jgi:hypothetical protein